MIEKKSIPEQFTLSVLGMLPYVNCVKPKDALSLMAHEKHFPSSIVMDDIEFRSDSFQRVYQYLRRHAANHNLDTFIYSQGSVEEGPCDFLQIVLR